MERRTLLILALITPLLLLAAYGLYQVNEDNQSNRRQQASTQATYNPLPQGSFNQQQLHTNPQSQYQASLFSRKLAISYAQANITAYRQAADLP